MPEGTVFVIHGKILGDLLVEEHSINGGSEALILHLDHAECLEFFRRIRPIGSVMNIRAGPGVLHSIIGKLLGSTEVVEEHVTDQNNIWVRIGYKQYVARIYKGTEYCVYEES